MIYYSLDFIKSQLNGYLKNLDRWGKTMVILSGLSEKNSESSSQHDGIRLSLLNICQESTMKNQKPFRRSGIEFERSSPALSFNLDFLISANCSKYEESLKLLSDAINFFQSHNYFDHSRSPDLSDQIQKLSLSILDNDFSELSHFWSSHGATYLPSIAYRMRIVSFDGSDIKERIPAVSSHDIND